MEALFREERAAETKLLGSGPNAGKVGAFEGAMYEATGYYRPAAGLHHVHARRSRLLRRLPTSHRAHHPHVREVNKPSGSAPPRKSGRQWSAPQAE